MSLPNAAFALLLAGAISIAVGWNLHLNRQNAGLRAELEMRAVRDREFAELLARPHLPADGLLENPSDLPVDHVTAAERDRLSAEIESLEDQVLALASRAQEPPSRNTKDAEGGAPRPPMVVDRGTPERALDSFMQAIAEADVAALAGIITLDDQARAEADRFHRELPEDIRAGYADGPALVAAFLAARSPANLAAAGAPEIVARTNTEVHLRVPLRSGSRGVKPVALRFGIGPDGWRLLVPAAVIAGYRYTVAGMPGSPTPP